MITDAPTLRGNYLSPSRARTWLNLIQARDLAAAFRQRETGSENR